MSLNQHERPLASLHPEQQIKAVHSRKTLAFKAGIGKSGHSIHDQTHENFVIKKSFFERTSRSSTKSMNFGALLVYTPYAALETREQK